MLKNSIKKAWSQSLPPDQFDYYLESEDYEKQKGKIEEEPVAEDHAYKGKGKQFNVFYGYPVCV